MDAPIPEGLAIDADGRPTTDSHAALAGSVLPFAGPKGSGLALAIGMLSAVLAQADFDDELASMYEDFDRPQNVGHLFIVIDPWHLSDREREETRLDGMIDRLGRLRPAQGSSSVQYPGQPEAALARERLECGIPIEHEELLAYSQLCTDCGFADLAATARDLAAGTELGPQTQTAVPGYVGPPVTRGSDPADHSGLTRPHDASASGPTVLHSLEREQGATE